MVKVYKGRGDVGNRFREAKTTLGEERPSCRRFAANQVRFLMGTLAYKQQPLMIKLYGRGDQMKRQIEWLIIIEPCYGDASR